jgi:hypothetical protein
VLYSIQQTGLKQAKGIISGPSARRMKDLLKLNRDQLRWVGRTTYRTLSPKRTPFQIEIDWWSHLRKVPRRRRISHTYPMWLWGHSIFKVVLHWTEWLLWCSHIQSPMLHSKCWINKGLIKRGSTIDHQRSRCKGWILCPIPYTYTCIYVHNIQHTLFFTSQHAKMHFVYFNWNNFDFMYI